MSRYSVPPRPEREILKAILDYLRLRPDVIAWRQNTGAVVSEHKGKQRMIRFGMLGMADIIGSITRRFKVVEDPPSHIQWRVWETAQAFAIEVKRPGEWPTPAQAAFLNAVRRRGWIAFVATSVEDVERELAGKYDSARAGRIAKED